MMRVFTCIAACIAGVILTCSGSVAAQQISGEYICCEAPTEDGGIAIYCGWLPEADGDVQPVLSAALYYWTSHDVHIDASGGPGSITCGPRDPFELPDNVTAPFAAWQIYVEGLHLDLHCFRCGETYKGDKYQAHDMWIMSDPLGPSWQKAEVVYSSWHQKMMGMPPGVYSDAVFHPVDAWSCQITDRTFSTCGPDWF